MKMMFGSRSAEGRATGNNIISAMTNERQFPILRLGIFEGQTVLFVVRPSGGSSYLDSSERALTNFRLKAGLRTMKVNRDMKSQSYPACATAPATQYCL